MHSNYQHIFEALPAPNFSNFVPLFFMEHSLGYVNRMHCSVFLEFSEIFQANDNDSLSFTDAFIAQSIADRSKALSGLSEKLRELGWVKNWRDELFAIYLDVNREEELFELERGVVPLMALQAHGVHLNGYVIIDNEPHIWIAQRSATRVIAPLKYDQLVAGGLPAELSLKDNLYKEANEEAGIAKDLVKPAKYQGKIQYMTEDEFGIRNDVLHCYDLQLPQDFEPNNQDGEVEQFLCLPISELVEKLSLENQFKANTALVMLNFLQRHRWIELSDFENQKMKDCFSL